MRKRMLSPTGVLIKEKLLETGMTQRELAKAIGTSEVYLNFILCGERSGKKYIHSIKRILNLHDKIPA